jgi:uncharacterized protein YjbI with pentapeptide repeats
MYAAVLGTRAVGRALPSGRGTGSVPGAGPVGRVVAAGAHGRVVAMVLVVSLLATVLVTGGTSVPVRPGRPEAGRVEAGGSAGVAGPAPASPFAFGLSEGAWPDLPVAHVATNLAAGLDVAVTAAGLRVAPLDRSTPIDLVLRAHGRPGELAPAAPGEVAAADTAITLDRGDVVEWFRNDRRGLEQGWTVPSRSGGVGPLVLDLEVRGATATLVGPHDARLVPGAGGRGASYGGLAAFDATGGPLPVRFEELGDGLRIVVDDRGATYPVVVDPVVTWTPVLESIDNATRDRFGESLALEGRWMAVGASGDTVAPGGTFHDGSVYVYFDESGQGDWVEVDRLHVEGLRQTGGWLGGVVGLRVAIDVEPEGVTVAAYAQQGQGARGNVVVWTFAGDPELQAPTAPASQPQVVLVPGISGVAVSRYGQGLALGGATLVIGAPGSSSQGRTVLGPEGTPVIYNDAIGFVDVLQRTDGFGSPFVVVQRLHAPLGLDHPVADERDARQYFGSAVAVAGDRLVVGAPGDDSVVPTPLGGQSTFQGAVHVYERGPEGTWVPQGTAVPAVREEGASFGASLALLGDEVVVGAPSDPGEGLPLGGVPGRVHVLARDAGSGAWVTVGDPVSGDDPGTPYDESHVNDRFGNALATLDGSVVLVSAPRSTTAAAPTSFRGGAVLLDRIAGSQPLQWRERVLGPQAGSIGVAHAVGLRSDEIVVGIPNTAHPAIPGNPTAPGLGFESGRLVRFRAVDGSFGDPVGTMLPRGDRFDARFGTAIARAGDVLVVTAEQERRNRTDPGSVHGPGTGSTHVFERVAGAWERVSLLGQSGVGPLSPDAGHGRAVAVWVRRDAAGNDIGAVVAVGRPLDSTRAADPVPVAMPTRAGSVGILRRGAPGTSWAQVLELVSDDPVADGRFGSAVAFTEHGTLVVGEPGAGSGTGAVHRFEHTGNLAAWQHHQRVDGSPPGARLGQAVAADGATVAVLAAGAGLVEVHAAGQATDLSLVGVLDLGAPASAGLDDPAGIAVREHTTDPGLGATTVAVGLPGQDQVQVWRAPSPVSAFTRTAEVPGSAGVAFGSVLVLPSTGPVTGVVVGVPAAAGGAGDVRVIATIDGGDSWELLDDPIERADRAAGDADGSALSWWSVEEPVAIGAPGSDDPDVDAGRVGFAPVALPEGAGPFEVFVDVAVPESTLVPGATFVPTAGLPPSLLTGATQTSGSLAATPIGSVDLEVPPDGGSIAASPLRSVPLGSLPLAATPLRSVPLSSLPLRSVDGGWEALLADSPFGGVPLQTVTLGDVHHLPAVQALDLGAIDLGATPLRSVPLVAVAIGSLPLRSVPLADGDPITAWCEAIDGLGFDPADLGLDCTDGDPGANDEVTLLHVALSGVPLDSLPIAAIPLRSVPLRSVPLRSVELAALDLAATPLRSVPLRSVDVAPLPLRSVPLRSVPLRSVPLRSVDLEAIVLAGTPLRSVPLRSVDLAATPLRSVPLRSVDLTSVDLAAIPLRSVPLRSVPLRSVDLEAIVLAGTPLRSVPLRSVDLAATPLRSVPLRSVDLTSVDLAAIPLRSVPLRSVPLRSVDLEAIVLAGTPLRSVPLRDLVEPGAGFRSSAIAAIPLRSVPLDAVVDCALLDCDAALATLGDALRAGALRPGATLGDLVGALDGIRLGDIAGAISGVTVQDVIDALGDLTLADLTDFDDVTLGELLVLAHQLTLGDLVGALDGIRLGDIAGAISGVTVQDVIDALGDLTLADLTDFDDVTLGELLVLADWLTFGDLFDALAGLRFADLVDVIAKEGGGTFSEAEIRAALEDALFGESSTFGDLGPDLDDLTLGDLLDFGGTTLGDLLDALDPGALDGITLGDLLLALIGRTQHPWERLDLARVSLQALDGVDAGIPVTVAFQLLGDAAAGPVRIEVRPPFGSALVPGSVVLSIAADPEDLEPRTLDGTLVWTLPAVPANAVHTLTLSVEPTLRIGTGQIRASVTSLRDDVTAFDAADLTVVEALEPNDTTAQATSLPTDTIALSHISSATDVDVFRFEVDRVGTRISAILSNLDADLDLALYGPRASSAEIGEPSSRSIVPVEDEGAPGIPGAVTVDPEPVEDRTAPPDLGDLALHHLSIGRGTTDERVDTGPLQRTGTYYLVVTGYNGATSRSPYALRLKDLGAAQARECPARMVPGAAGGALPDPSALPEDVETLVVVNRSRFAALHGADGSAQVDGALQRLTDYLAGPDGAHLGVHAAVLDIGGDPTVRAAYQAWDGAPCDPATANGVVGAVVDVIDRYRDGRDVRHIVLVGGDDVVPFARTPDRTQIANERSYASTFADGEDALWAAFATAHLLTDDPYGDTDPYRFGDRALFVVDAAVGRLVEAPAEIARAMDDLVAAGGLLDVETGMVAGYDFLIDGSEAVADGLRNAVGALDTSLVSDTWTRADLEALLLPDGGTAPDIASVNAHFDHFRALPADGNASGDESDLFLAATIAAAAPDAVAGSLLFSMGCHGGLSVSDLLVAGDRAIDFAQAVSAGGGVFVGNTGYGYGDTEIVGLSERLMAGFARRLDGSLSIGEALRYAKQEYAADLTMYGVYDEKALMEATLYGLPFYRLAVDDPPPPPSPPLPPQLAPDPIAGVDTTTVVVTGTAEPRTADGGATYWVSNDPLTGEERTTAVHDRPVQPRERLDLGMPDGVEPHDALVVGLTTTDHTGVLPHLVQPIVDHGDERVGVVADVTFPSSPLRLNPQDSPGGPLAVLSVTSGWFRTTARDGTGTQRLLDEVIAQPYFAAEGVDDFTRPTLTRVEALVVDGILSVAVDVADDNGGPEGVRRVLVLAVEEPDPGVPTAWHSLDLVRTPGSARWTGSMPVDAGDVEYLVQAVDASGNVGVSTNKARNFRDAEPPLDPPATDLEVGLDGPVGGAGWYTGSVSVSASGGTSLTYEVVGTQAEQPYTGPFVISADGPHLVVVRSADGQQVTRAVRIDSTGPQAVVTNPVHGSVHLTGTTLPVTFSCPDAGSGASGCSATLDGRPIASGHLLDTSVPGTWTVEVTAEPDHAGNAPAVPVAVATVRVIAPPSIQDVWLPDGAPRGDDPLSVAASFEADPIGAPHWATFTWADGTVTRCRTDQEPTDACAVALDAHGQGQATATHAFADGDAERSVTITVSDRLGGSDARSLTVNRTTSLVATPAVFRIDRRTGEPVHQAGAISARLRDQHGEPIVGRTIRFRADGNLLCSAMTDTSGWAGCENPQEYVFGVRESTSGRYQATFAGGGGYLSVTAESTLVLVR